MHIKSVARLIFSFFAIYSHIYCHSLYKTIEIKAPYPQTLIMKLPTDASPKLILGNFSLENQSPTEISEFSITPNQIIISILAGLDTTVSQGATILILKEMQESLSKRPNIQKENKTN